MEVKIYRNHNPKTGKKYNCNGYSIGHCYINGEYFCDTIEDVDRGLKQSMSLDEIKAKKIYGETAIPVGTYNLGFTYSTQFANTKWAKPYKGKVISIDNVKGYSGVRIHPFNTAKESLGCIALGNNNVKGKVTNSTAYYLKFLTKFYLPAINRGEKVTLTIINIY